MARSVYRMMYLKDEIKKEEDFVKYNRLLGCLMVFSILEETSYSPVWLRERIKNDEKEAKRSSQIMKQMLAKQHAKENERIGIIESLSKCDFFIPNLKEKLEKLYIKTKTREDDEDKINVLFIRNDSMPRVFQSK